VPLSGTTVCAAEAWTVARQLSPGRSGRLGLPLSAARPDPDWALSGQVRWNTESDYQREIAQYLGWRPFDAEAHTWLREWIVEQVVQYLYGGREPFVQYFRWRVSDVSLRRSPRSLSDKADRTLTV
jgi:hypothetical protein